MMSRYKPVGWQGESHRHYLASKGVKTKYNHEQHQYHSTKVCLECGQKYETPIYMGVTGKQAHCPSCGSIGSMKTDSPETLPKAAYMAKKYPNLFVTDETPDIPVQGKTLNESIAELESKLAAKKRGEKVELAPAPIIDNTEKLYDHPPTNAELTQDDFKFPQESISLSARGEELVKDKAELARLEKEYSEIHAKNEAIKAEAQERPKMFASKVDLSKYAGTWRQKDVEPEPFYQKGLTNVKATYTPRKDGSIKVVNTGIDKDGKTRRIEGTAKPVSADNRNLEVMFGKSPIAKLFMRGNYKIAKVNNKYTKATVKGGDGTTWHLVR